MIYALGFNSVKYGKCIILPKYESRAEIEKYIAELMANPPEKYKDDIAKYGGATFFVAEMG